jgi:hypothetical protein
MDTRASLDTCLLVGRDNELIITEMFAMPDSLIEVKDASGFSGKVRIAGEDPGTVLPGTNSVFIEPAPYRSIADRSYDPTTTRFPRYLRDTPARQRKQVL